MSESDVGCDLAGVSAASAAESAAEHATASLAARVKALIADRLGIDVDRLEPDTELASLGVDSLGIIELMFEMEEKLDIRLPPAQVPPVTVKQVIDELDRGLRARGAVAAVDPDAA